MQGKVYKVMAEKIKDVATNVSRKTVGRSLPYWVHEVKVEEDVWKWLEDDRRNGK